MCTDHNCSYQTSSLTELLLEIIHITKDITSSRQLAGAAVVVVVAVLRDYSCRRTSTSPLTIAEWREKFCAWAEERTGRIQKTVTLTWKLCEV